MGYDGIDLLHPQEVEHHPAFRAGVSGDGGPGACERDRGIERAFNRIEHHDTLLEIYRETIPAAAAAGIPNVICFSGNRDGMSDGEGLENCARGLERVLPLAERYGVTLVMELLNSRVDHPGYQCDRTEWGVALCKRLGDPRFKLAV
jgi:hydroxypyruvate isomerase